MEMAGPDAPVDDIVGGFSVIGVLPWDKTNWSSDLTLEMDDIDELEFVRLAMSGRLALAMNEPGLNDRLKLAMLPS